MLKREIGNIGEKAVARAYQKKGYSVLERNFSLPYGEIDIIAKDKKNDTIVFIEVKARSEDSIARPCEFVTPAKMRRIILAAKTYISYRELKNVNFRFDVAEVIHTKDVKPKILSVNIIENAFTL